MTVTKISDGLGYGNQSSAISVTSEDKELMHRVDEALHSDSLIVPLSLDEAGQPVRDDGCGDGRMCVHVYPHEHRAKVFGGGLTMTVSMLIGLGKATGQAPEHLFADGITVLRDSQLDFGAHTDDHAVPPNSGCGAIDKFPEILETSTDFTVQIAASIRMLGMDTNLLDEVQAAFQQYVQDHTADPYSGHTVSEMIVHEGKLVKELTGTHVEKAIVLNMIAGSTVDQKFVYENTNGKAEVFAVDVWRMQELADTQYSTAPLRQKAFLSELVYTLATAAVLTQGSLPVYVVQTVG
jgi:Cadmium carbonic anhydrase repeat